MKKGWTGDIKGPFNVEARERAGLTPEFYQNLTGELGGPPKEKLPDENARVTMVAPDSLCVKTAAMSVEYESTP